MEIINVNFEESTTLILKDGSKVTLTPFKEHDPNIIKIGIAAPKNVRVNREEVQRALEEGEY